MLGVVCLLASLGNGAGAEVAAPSSAAKWEVIEITLTVDPADHAFDDTGRQQGQAGTRTVNPFLVDVEARFEHLDTGATHIPFGFYDGNGVFKVRFSPPIEGVWAWTTASTSIPALHKHAGKVTVLSTGSVAKGCPSSQGKKLGFAFPDGSTYNPVGTTCYAWVHQPEGDALEEQTLSSLKSSPFNKVRMTGFPKWYPFTHHEPRFYPYVGNFSEGGNSSWDFTRFNPQFWQHYEQRVQDVVALGVVPEIILFHPYDGGHWGFDRMNQLCGKAGTPSASQCSNTTAAAAECLWCDENYIKYMVARVSAYGTWWSMANEWDLMKKTVGQWDTLFQTLQAADAAHNRERSIHNCMKYYNNSQPWITHISLQGHHVNQLDMAKAVWTTKTPKPIVWDEVEYEGNITYGWGSLSGYNESRRAWTAFTNQVAMAGHSNTNLPEADYQACLANGTDPNNVNCNAIMWWNKGDLLHGESPARLEYYRQYIGGELGVQVPPLELTRSARLGGGEENGTYSLYAQDGSYHLLFWRDNNASVEIDLGVEGSHVATQIDWWGMKMVPMSGGKPLSGKVTITPPPGSNDALIQLVKQK